MGSVRRRKERIRPRAPYRRNRACSTRPERASVRRHVRRHRRLVPYRRIPGIVIRGFPRLARLSRTGVVRVPRLFAGTPWDRPATCERWGRLESQCSCPPPVPEAKRIPPQQQTARLMTERRAKGKRVTVTSGLDAKANDHNGLETVNIGGARRGASGAGAPRRSSTAEDARPRLDVTTAERHADCAFGLKGVLHVVKNGKKSEVLNLKPAERPGGSEPGRAEAAPSELSHHYDRIPRFGTKWQLLGHGFVPFWHCLKVTRSLVLQG
jgi:hypothetical protein